MDLKMAPLHLKLYRIPLPLLCNKEVNLNYNCLVEKGNY